MNNWAFPSRHSPRRSALTGSPTVGASHGRSPGVPLQCLTHRSQKAYLFPLERLCVLQSITQFEISVAPPLDQAVAWSASISFSL